MILKIICLFWATICTILFFIGSFKGGKYDAYIKPLDGKSYPMKDFYVIGWFLNSTRIFKLRGKMEQDLKKQAKLIWDNAYSEFYAVTTWVQFLTAALFTCCVGFILCGMAKEESAVMMLGIMILALMAEWNLIISRMKEDIQKRRESCELEFPNMILKLSLLINSGMILREAWELVSYGKEGELYRLMKISCEYMRNGDSDAAAIHKFGVLSDSPEVKKFSSSVVQGLEKGNGELGELLMSQASEQLAHKRQLALQAGEKAAGKLIIPLGITFAGIIMIIVSGVMQGMSF